MTPPPATSSSRGAASPTSPARPHAQHRLGRQPARHPRQVAQPSAALRPSTWAAMSACAAEACSPGFAQRRRAARVRERRRARLVDASRQREHPALIEVDPGGLPAPVIEQAVAGARILSLGRSATLSWRQRGHVRHAADVQWRDRVKSPREEQPVGRSTRGAPCPPNAMSALRRFHSTGRPSLAASAPPSPICAVQPAAGAWPMVCPCDTTRST